MRTVKELRPRLKDLGETQQGGKGALVMRILAKGLTKIDADGAVNWEQFGGEYFIEWLDDPEGQLSPGRKRRMTLVSK